MLFLELWSLEIINKPLTQITVVKIFIAAIAIRPWAPYQEIAIPCDWTKTLILSSFHSSMLFPLGFSFADAAHTSGTWKECYLSHRSIALAPCHLCHTSLQSTEVLGESSALICFLQNLYCWKIIGSSQTFSISNLAIESLKRDFSATLILFLTDSEFRFLKHNKLLNMVCCPDLYHLFPLILDHRQPS